MTYHEDAWAGHTDFTLIITPQQWKRGHRVEGVLDKASGPHAVKGGHVVEIVISGSERHFLGFPDLADSEAEYKLLRSYIGHGITLVQQKSGCELSADQPGQTKPTVIHAFGCTLVG